MNKQLSIVGLLTLFLVGTTAYSQKSKEKEIKLKEVVVIATKFKLEKEKIGKVITKITQEEIQNNAGKTIFELLNNVSGVEIKGINSNPGEIKGIYIRGGRSKQVLVLIDGIPVSDPTGVNQEYDLRLLSLNQIESIEILKGASSTLYGSGAATGVINIILKKGNKKDVSATYEVSLGTNNDANTKNLRLLDRNQNVSIHGSLKNFNYLATFTISGVDGMSSAKSKTNKSFSTDPFYNKSSLVKLGYRFSNQFELETFVNYDTFKYTYDAGAYSNSDINNGEDTQVRIGVKPSFKYNNGEAYLQASFNDVNRVLHTFNSYANGVNKYDYTGKSINIDAVNRLTFSEGTYQLITGINYQEHRNNTLSDFGNIDDKLANFNNIDPYASLVYNSTYGLNINIGGRLNNHSNYGNHFVYDTNVSYNFNVENVKIKALTSYSTAFIAPSTYQLFSQYGNLNLNPESSNTFEFGFEAAHKKMIQFDAVYFNRSVEDAIIFVSLPVAPWTSSYENATGKTKVSGIETNVTITAINNVKLLLGYTNINKDSDADYIPKNKFLANLEALPFKNAFVSLVYKKVGERTYFDKWGSFGAAGDDVILPSYNLLDVNANYKLLNNMVTFFGSVSNLLNEDYEETLGYSTRGRNFKLGIRLQF
tara:strand:- start:1028 stop:2974 length:1947 start_codon:yes stop_codon:yes gene_type:complete